MLSSIHPFGERARNNHFATTAAAYLAGSVAGGVTSAAVAGAVGSLLALSTAAALWILGAGIGIGVVADLGIAGVSVPSWRRQVNERWLDTYRGWVVGVAFGFQLGTGVVTIVTTSAVWSTWLAAMLAPSFAGSIVIGVVFGAVRGSFILATRHVRQPSQLRALHRRLAASAPIVARLTPAAVATTGVGAVLGALLMP